MGLLWRHSLLAVALRLRRRRRMKHHNQQHELRQEDKKRITRRRCFGRKRTSTSIIYLRGGPKIYPEEISFYLYQLPPLGAWLCHQKLLLSNNKKKRRKLVFSSNIDMSFNHYAHHRHQPHAKLPLPNRITLKTVTDTDDDAGLDLSAWAALGTNIYFFGGPTYGRSSREICYLRTDDAAVGSTSSSKRMKLEKVGCMISRREKAEVVALDGKVYIFGGQSRCGADEVSAWAEVFEPLPNCGQGQSRALSSPSPSPCICHVDFAVGVEKERKIVVGWDGGDSMYEYYIDSDHWEKHEISFAICLRTPLCQPIVVDSIMYWLDTEMRAYDLKNRLLFSGQIEDTLIHEFVGFDHPYLFREDFAVTLLHLAGEHFCMIWVDPCKPGIIHCTTIQALRTASCLQAYHSKRQEKHYKLRTSVLSCQTFTCESLVKLQDCALVI